MVFDRGYTDYQWYQELTKDGVHFVTRLKRGAAVQSGAKRRGAKARVSWKTGKSGSEEWRACSGQSAFWMKREVRNTSL